MYRTLSKVCYLLGAAGLLLAIYLFVGDDPHGYRNWAGIFGAAFLILGTVFRELARHSVS